MGHDMIDRDAARMAVPLIAHGRGHRAAIAHELLELAVELGGADAGLDMGRDEVERLGGDAAGAAHALEAFLVMEQDFAAGLVALARMAQHQATRLPPLRSIFRSGLSPSRPRCMSVIISSRKEGGLLSASRCGRSSAMGPSKIRNFARAMASGGAVRSFVCCEAR